MTCEKVFACLSLLCTRKLMGSWLSWPAVHLLLLCHMNLQADCNMRHGLGLTASWQVVKMLLNFDSDSCKFSGLLFVASAEGLQRYSLQYCKGNQHAVRKGLDKMGFKVLSEAD